MGGVWKSGHLSKAKRETGYALQPVGVFRSGSTLSFLLVLRDIEASILGS